MRDDKISLYLHLVWSTWDRVQVIDSQIEGPLYRCIQEQAIANNCSVVAINGTKDHIHVLVGLAPTISVASLIKRLKGVSSRFVNDSFHLEQPFKWAGTYAAFSVSRWDVRKVREYIRSQKEHHASGILIGEMEATADGGNISAE